LSTLELLRKAVDKAGLLHIAQILGENSTRNIEAWLRDQKIPKTKEVLIRKAIESDDQCKVFLEV